MKKLLFGLAVSSLALNVFCQGTVIFENSLGSGNATFNGILLQPGDYTVALLFNPSGTLGVAQSSLFQIAVYKPSIAANDGAGYFYDSLTVTTPSGSGVGTFEVVGWIGGNFNTWAAASANGALGVYGITEGSGLVEFLSEMGDPNPPVTAPINLSGPGNPNAWNGNLVIDTPEPSTIALGGLGVATFLARCRRK